MNNSSYNFDGATTLLNIISRNEKPKETDTLPEIILPQLHEIESLTDEEEEILYKMCGYIVFKLKKRIKCTNCYSKLLHSDPVYHPRSGLVKACEFFEGILISVSDEVFKLLKTVELILQAIKNKVKYVGQGLKTKLEHHLRKELTTFTISTCHNTKDLLISRYCRMRLYQISSDLSNISIEKSRTAAFGSKSMGSRLLADNFNPTKKNSFNCNALSINMA